MLWFDEEIRIDRDISDILVKLSIIFKLNIIISAVIIKLFFHLFKIISKKEKLSGFNML